MKKILYIMCGISGSGKSTFVKNNLKENEVWISRDKIRFSLVKENEKYFSKENLVYKTFVEEIQKCLDDKEIKAVYADATHLNEKSRLKLLNSLKLNKDIFIIPIYFTVSLNTALNRNCNRTGREFIPEMVIKNQLSNYTPPAHCEDIYMYDEIWQVNEKGKVKKFNNWVVNKK